MGPGGVGPSTTLAQARLAIESLRAGLPPEGLVQFFTVGRASEVRRLTETLESGQGGALLLQANYGSGKSHLLRLVREVALAEGFAVASVTVDSRSGVRFNRLDQVLGAVWRGLEVPDVPPGAACALFRRLEPQLEKSERARDKNSVWYSVTHRSRWHFNLNLTSRLVFAALRGWHFGTERTKNLVHDWLSRPDAYQSQKKRLYQELVRDLAVHFQDQRDEREMLRDGTFTLRTGGYAPTWEALRDLHSLARHAGLKGLVLLFDEFEDVITNLNNVTYQMSSFENLFRFFGGEAFPGAAFFAVTPDFAAKCADLLERKVWWHDELFEFDALPRFELSPLGRAELAELTDRVVQAHGLAYGWDAGRWAGAPRVLALADRAATQPVEGRTRWLVKALVDVLDAEIER